MKRKILCTWVISSFLLLSGCTIQQPKLLGDIGQQIAQTQEKKKDGPAFDISTQEGIQNLAQAIENKNQKISSVQSDLDSTYVVDELSLNLKIENVIVYNTKNHEPKRYYIHREAKSYLPDSLTEIVFQAPNRLYLKQDDSPWTSPDHPKSYSDFLYRVDYHACIGILTDILRNEPHDIKENGNFYDIVLTDKNYDFVNKFHEQINLMAYESNSADASLEIILQVDKNTLYLHTVKFIVKNDLPDSKRPDVTANIKMFAHNSADTSIIKQTLKRAKRNIKL